MKKQLIAIYNSGINYELIDNNMQIIKIQDKGDFDLFTVKGYEILNIDFRNYKLKSVRTIYEKYIVLRKYKRDVYLVYNWDEQDFKYVTTEEILKNRRLYFNIKIKNDKIYILNKFQYNQNNNIDIVEKYKLIKNYRAKTLLLDDSSIHLGMDISGNICTVKVNEKINSRTKQIIIPDFVDIIGEESFMAYIEAEELILGKNVKFIEYRAFSSCENLRNIIFNEKLKVIGEYAFENCYSLTSLTFNNNLKTISKGAFKRCTLLNTLNLNDNLVEIKDIAFNQTAIRKFKGNKQLKSLGTLVFFDSKIEEVDLRDTQIKNLDLSAFRAFTSPQVGDKNRVYLDLKILRFPKCCEIIDIRDILSDTGNVCWLPWIELEEIELPKDCDKLKICIHTDGLKQLNINPINDIEIEDVKAELIKNFCDEYKFIQFMRKLIQSNKSIVSFSKGQMQ